MAQLEKMNRNGERISSKPRILIIDDDETILELVKDILSFDYIVTTANQGQQGLALLNREHFDLLILDLGLPGISGIDIIQQLRGKDGQAQLPILVLSAYTELAHRLEGLKVEAALSKPFSLARFERTVAELLRGKASSWRAPGTTTTRAGFQPV